MFARDPIPRRSFLAALGVGAASLAGVSAVHPDAVIGPTKRLKRVGLQLYTLRDDAKRDLERTLADIAAAGYTDVELLGSMDNFGRPPAKLRATLDKVGLRAPSTHVSGTALDTLDRQLDDAHILGHQYIIVASLPIKGAPTLDDYRHWADRLNEAGHRTRGQNVWIGFHNHADDFKPIDGKIPYDLLADRTDPSVVRLQLDTGNLAEAGRDPFEYLKRYGNRYWSFHIKDVPQMKAAHDVELGKGIIDFPRFIAAIPNRDQKLLFVEQEWYPGTPLDSVRRDHAYMAALRV